MTIPRQYAATAGLIALIVYLSLYPFQWRPHLPSVGPLVVFARSWRTWAENRGDFITNIAFYIPCGCLVVRCFKGRMSGSGRLLASWLLCTTLSVCLELSQFYIAHRFSDIRDTYANSIGALLGAVAWLILKRERPAVLIENIRRQPFPAFLLAAFVSARLYPFIPVIGVHKFLDAMRPLLAFAPHEALLGIACWMAVYFLLECVFGRRHVIPLFIGIAALVFGGNHHR